jgi:hypothetical protein
MVVLLKLWLKLSDDYDVQKRPREMFLSFWFRVQKISFHILAKLANG